MTTKHGRMIREHKTIEAMIAIYCRDHHGEISLCAKCTELLEYAHRRLDLCPFQENKTTCANCPVHCYKRDMRQKVKEVMRYSGPRMTYLHPVLAIMHFIDGLRKKPDRSGQKSTTQ